MNKLSIKRFLYVFILSLVFSFSGYDSVVLSDESFLAYYGFAMIDCGFDDPHDQEIKTNYIDEVSGFTNVGHMCTFSEEDDLSTRMLMFHLAEMKAILHVEAILFEHSEDPFSPSGLKVVLRQDADLRWARFVDLNSAILTPKYIAAIYVVDEPAWNGVTEKDFKEALRMVKSSLPRIPTMAVESYAALDRIMVPHLLDWFGFNRYEVVNPETDKNWRKDFHTLISARTRNTQKLVIVADTQWYPYYGMDAGIEAADMGKVMLSYYQVASSHPDVVALIGYLWPGGFDDAQQVGARHLPHNVQEVFEEIGRKITHK